MSFDSMEALNLSAPFQKNLNMQGLLNRPRPSRKFDVKTAPVARSPFWVSWGGWIVKFHLAPRGARWTFCPVALPIPYFFFCCRQYATNTALNNAGGIHLRMWMCPWDKSCGVKGLVEPEPCQVLRSLISQTIHSEAPYIVIKSLKSCFNLIWPPQGYTLDIGAADACEWIQHRPWYSRDWKDSCRGTTPWAESCPLDSFWVFRPGQIVWSSSSGTWLLLGEGVVQNVGSLHNSSGWVSRSIIMGGLAWLILPTF